MKLKRYRPLYFEGFDKEFFEINTKDELLNLDFIKSWIKDGFEITIKYPDLLMAVMPDKSEWWVVANINNSDDANLLSEWFPLFRTD